MDPLQYEQYASVIMSGDISLDALKRIIRHDDAHGWGEDKDPGSLARRAVLADCERGKIKPHKLYDEKGDMLYGNDWPLPISFVRKQHQ